MEISFFIENKTLIMTLFDSPFKWELLDLLMQDPTHFTNIGKIFTSCMQENDINFIWRPDRTHLFTMVILALGRQTLKILNPSYGILDKNKMLSLGLFNLIEQGVLLYRKYFIKSNEFNTMFNTKLYEYLLEQITLNNVSAEFFELFIPFLSLNNKF